MYVLPHISGIIRYACYGVNLLFIASLEVAPFPWKLSYPSAAVEKKGQIILYVSKFPSSFFVQWTSSSLSEGVFRELCNCHNGPTVKFVFKDNFAPTKKLF